MGSPSLLRSSPSTLAVQLLAAESVTAWSVFCPLARSVTLMLSGRLPSWLSASAQTLCTVASVFSEPREFVSVVTPASVTLPVSSYPSARPSSDQP